MNKRIIMAASAMSILTAVMLFGSGHTWKMANNVQLSLCNGKPNYARAMEFPPVDRVYDVREYGAVGQGTTDDHDALAAANLAATTETNGGTVVLPPGTYIVGGNLSFDRKVSVVLANGAVLSIRRGTTAAINGTLDLTGGSIGGQGTLAFGSSSSAILPQARQIFRDDLKVTGLDNVADGVLHTSWFGRTQDQLQKAINLAIQGGLVCEFEPVTYTLTSGFSVTDTDYSAGYGPPIFVGTRPRQNATTTLAGGTIFSLSGADFVLFQFTDMNDVVIHDIGIQGSSKTAHTGIKLDDCINPRIWNVCFTNMLVGIQAGNTISFGHRYDRLKMMQMGTGVLWGGGLNTSSIKNSEIELCDTANIHLAGGARDSKNLGLSNLNLESHTTSVAILIDPNSGGYDQVSINDIYTEGNLAALKIGTGALIVKRVRVNNLLASGRPTVILDRVNDIRFDQGASAYALTQTGHTRFMRFAQSYDVTGAQLNVLDAVSVGNGNMRPTYNLIPDHDFRIAFDAGLTVPAGSDYSGTGDIRVDVDSRTPHSPYWYIQPASGWAYAAITVDIPGDCNEPTLYYAVAAKSIGSTDPPYIAVEQYNGSAWTAVENVFGQISTSWPKTGYQHFVTLAPDVTKVKLGVYVNASTPCCVDAMYLGLTPFVEVSNPANLWAGQSRCTTDNVTGYSRTVGWDRYLVLVSPTSNNKIWVTYSGRTFTIWGDAAGATCDYIVLPTEGVPFK